MRIEELVDLFEQRLWMPNPTPLYAMLGAVAANRLSGEPVWLLLIGPPGSGKTEILQSITGLDDVYPASDITVAGLLSGTSERERSREATGGLLRAIGSQGIILAKDFTSVLSMHREARGHVLSALREIYDGSWARHLGSDGGRLFGWQGKVGLIGACTEVIDTHHSVMATMGERFVLLRLDEVDGDAQARRALEMSSAGKEMRGELRRAVTQFFSERRLTSTKYSMHAREQLGALGTLVARCRSASVRDSRSREIEVVTAPEGPARIVKVLDRLRDGLQAIGLAEPAAMKVVATLGMDCMPVVRHRIISALSKAPLRSLVAVADATGHPKSTVERALEDLQLHGVVERQASGNAHTYRLSEWTALRIGSMGGLPRAWQNRNAAAWPGAVPEESDTVRAAGIPEVSHGVAGPGIPETSDPSIQVRGSDDTAGKLWEEDPVA